MTEFNCTICNYSTDDKSNFIKHKNTTKHNKKVQETNKKLIAPRKSSNILAENVFQCPHCENKYTRVGNLTRHKKICPENPDINNKKIEVLELNNDKLQKEIEYLKSLHDKDAELAKSLRDKDAEVVKQLKDQVTHLKSLINNAGAVIKTSVSALAFVAQNYKDAPRLQKLNDYSYIQYEDENDEFDLLQIVFTHHRTNTLAKYLGDIIVNVYKKENPEEQSIWNSDSVRLTYLIKDLIDKKETDWTVDKKGVKTTKYIIDPLLEYLKILLNKYIDENGLENYCHENYTDFKKRTDDMETTIEIIASITNKILSPQIIKYIAPHFFLTKNDELVDI